MDVTQALKDAENALRDFIAAVLSSKYGEMWVDKLGVSPGRLARWKEHKEAEAKRQEAGVVEERILYYADFNDLRTIIENNWQDFTLALGEWKTMAVWLTELKRLRDPDAHRRELLPHQKHLILGISGEIRNRIVRYRSKLDTAEDCFPRIESVRDSLGNIWTTAQPFPVLSTNTILRPGDVIDFVVTATDPLGGQLSYGLRAVRKSGGLVWQDGGSLSLRITKSDISRRFFVHLLVKSPRDFHASKGHDDRVTFVYDVLPGKQDACS